MLKTERAADAPSDTDPRIVAFVFESSIFAQQALFAAMRLQEHGLITIHDAVFVSRPSRRAARVTETIDPTPAAAAVPASLVGAVVGILVAGPVGFLIGGVLTGVFGALAAKLYDLGIPHQLVAQLRKATQPGQSALALQVGDIGGAAVIDELRRFQGAQLVYSQLPPAHGPVVEGAPRAIA